MIEIEHELMKWQSEKSGPGDSLPRLAVVLTYNISDCSKFEICPDYNFYITVMVHWALCLNKAVTSIDKYVYVCVCVHACLE